MRRFPFYAYPNIPYSFSPSEASVHRPFSNPAFSPTPTAPTPRYVINVPVSDSAPSQPSSSPARPPLAALPLIDPSTAATTIQSHFRGFCVRRHHPLLHLRSIARARKQLEELQSEFERPEFFLKVRASEKERLRFNENVMAILLSLDAIEGSMAEVRSQRKEATKMAIKLQDAIDAMVMQKDEIAALGQTGDKGGIAPSEGGVAPSEDSALLEQPLEEKSLCPEEDDADKPTPNHAKTHVMEAEDVAPLHPCKMDLDQQAEAGLGFVEAHVQHAKTMCNAEQDMSHVTGEKAGSDAPYAAEEGENGIDALHLEAQRNHMENESKVDEDTCVDDMINAGNCSAERESFDGSYTCMDVVKEGKKGAGQDVGTPTAEENCDFTHCQGPFTSLEWPTEGKCYLNDHDFPTPQRQGYGERSDEALEANSSDAVKTQICTLSIAETPSAPQGNPIIHQLSEDCRQLKSLVGKLLVQNKVQSNILYALAERLETLEHQQHLSCWHGQKKMREKRKLKKGSKRIVKYRNWECY